MNNEVGSSSKSKDFSFKQNIILMIVVTIVGSFIFGVFFSTFTNICSNKLISCISTISSSLADHIYAEAAKGFHEEYSYTLYLFFLVFWIMAVIFCVISGKKSYNHNLQMYSIVKSHVHNLKALKNKAKTDENETDNSRYLDEALEDLAKFEKEIKSAKHYLACSLCYAILVIIFFTFTFISSNLITSVRTSTLQNIEITSAYISDKEYKQLKSDFYSMDCEADYEKLYNSLNGIAKKNNIDLRE